MSETTEVEESPQSSSAEAQSCGALEWRDERPSQEGFFWFDPPNEAPQVIQVYASDSGKNLFITGNNIHRCYLDQIDDHSYFADAKWAGPIPEPSEA